MPTTGERAPGAGRRRFAFGPSLRLIRSCALASVLATTACSPSQPIILAGWHVPFLGPPANGNILVSLGFESSGATAATDVIPPQVQAILLELLGPGMASPKESWWHTGEGGGGKTVTLSIGELGPGHYSVTLILFGLGGQELGRGFGGVDVATGATEHLSLLMVYQLGAASDSINFGEATPSVN